MARLAATFLAMALLCVIASGLSPDPLAFRPQRGASAVAERLRQGSVLDDYLRPGNLSCEASCNNQTLSSGECEGAFRARCRGSIGKPGRNATILARVGCNGHWTEARGNDSAESSAVGREVTCNGAFRERVLVLSEVRDEAVFAATAYGCAFMFNFEATGLGEARVRSHTCQGAETVKSMFSRPERGGIIGAASRWPVRADKLRGVRLASESRRFTLKDLEAILEDVAPDDDLATLGDDSGKPEDAPVADRRPWRDDRNVSVTCNGEEASFQQPCHGTLQITLEGRNVTIAQMCKGWWFPSPGPRHGFACSGDWTVGLSGRGGRGFEMDSSCSGHTAAMMRVVSAHGRTFRGSRELCIGQAEGSVQLPGPHPAQSVGPAA